MATGPVWNRTAKHDKVRAWADARGAKPARVRGTSDALKLKIGEDETSWELISWDDFFSVFDEKEFAFVFEDPGFASKIVRRNGTEDQAPGATPEAAH
ncbi:MAG: hypothetical protein JNK05_29450 [Myxococcales bacterium]|nr:hypothetical protein [Myxococcales bacterium]